MIPRPSDAAAATSSRLLREADELIARGEAGTVLRRLRGELARDLEPTEAAPLRLIAARALIALGRDEEAIEELIAIEGALPEVEAARIGALLAALRVVTGQAAHGGVGEATKALAAGRRIRDPGTIAAAWQSLSLAHYYRGDITEAVHAAEEGLAWTREARGGPTEAEGTLTLGVAVMHADDFDRAAVLLDRAADASSPDRIAVDARLHRAFLDFHAGRWQAASETIEVAMAEMQLPDWLAGFSAGILALMQVHCDRIEAAIRSLELAPTVVAPSPRPMHLWATMLVALARDDVARAVAVAERLVRVTRTLGSPVRFRLYGPDVVSVLVEAGDQVTATEVATTLEMVAGRANVPSVTAAALLCRGLIERDVTMIDAAAVAFEAGPRVFDAASARMRHADALAASGRHEEAATGYERALTMFTAIGADRQVRLADRALRELGRRPGRRGRRGRPTTGWSSLTATELQVAELVGHGLTNAEVAQRLVVSPRTVEAHISHVFAKLQIGSRTQLAIFARDRGV